MYSISQFVLKDIIGEDQYPHFLHVMALLFVVNVLIMLLIGRFFPRKEAYVQVFTEEVDISPWRRSNLVGILICILVISIYVYFA